MARQMDIARRVQELSANPELLAANPDMVSQLKALLAAANAPIGEHLFDQPTDEQLERLAELITVLESENKTFTNRIPSSKCEADALIAVFEQATGQRKVASSGGSYRPRRQGVNPANANAEPTAKQVQAIIRYRSALGQSMDDMPTTRQTASEEIARIKPLALAASDNEVVQF